MQRRDCSQESAGIYPRQRLKSSIVVGVEDGQVDLIDDGSEKKPFHFGLLCFGLERTKIRPLKRSYPTAITALNAAYRQGWKIL